MPYSIKWLWSVNQKNKIWISRHPGWSCNSTEVKKINSSWLLTGYKAGWREWHLRCSLVGAEVQVTEPPSSVWAKLKLRHQIIVPELFLSSQVVLSSLFSSLGLNELFVAIKRGWDSMIDSCTGRTHTTSPVQDDWQLEGSGGVSHLIPGD